MHEQLSNLPGRHHAPVQRHSQGWSRLTGLGALLMGLGVPGAVLATVDLAQRPLISSEGSSPKPNLMLTVDTSGSMSLRHMPEGTAKVNGVDLSVTTGSMWRVHPGDWDTNELQPGQSAANLVALTTMPSSVTQGQLNVNQLRAQIYARSPAVNTVYYDPRVRYRPWATLSTPTGRFPDAKFNRAYVDPNRQVDTNPNHRFVDFTQISNYRICVRPGVCTNGSFSQRPAIVYMLQSSSANPTNLGNFVRYDIFGGGHFQVDPLIQAAPTAVLHRVLLRKNSKILPTGSCTTAPGCSRHKQRYPKHFTTWTTLSASAGRPSVMHAPTAG